jgi:hypothetical protein
VSAVWGWLLLCVLVPAAGTAHDAGGEVIRLPGDPAVSGFLAQPAAGFRFAGWQGDCETTIGPLCTLTGAPSRNLAARFEPAWGEPAPARAVLLLHGAGQDRRVWDETVNRQFAGHCPAIYGGVILGRDGEMQPGQLRCYRIEFGYYEALADGTFASGDRSGTDQLGAELRAAVVGLQQRHPQLELVLAGQGRGTAVARWLLRKGGRQRKPVAGLVEVRTQGGRTETGAVETADLERKAKDLLGW